MTKRRDRAGRPTGMRLRGRWTAGRWCLTFALLLAPPGAHAAFSQDLVTGTIGVVDPPGIIDRPGGFISTFSGYTTGGNPDPGFDLQTAFQPGFSHAQEDFFTSSGAASSASMYPPAAPLPPTQAWSNGTARLGRVSFAGRAEQVFDFANFAGAGGAVNGGWVDTITVDSPGLTGTAAIWLFEVDISVALDAEGLVANGIMEVEAFVDQTNLPIATPGFDDGQFNWPVSTGKQHAEWRLVLPSIGAKVSTSFTDTVTFAAPITIGTPFDLGIFALGSAGAATNPSFQTIGSIGEFDGTATWGGDAGLTTTGGAPIGSYQLASLSGTDWVQPIPVPGVAWLTAMAAVLLIRRRLPSAQRHVAAVPSCS